MPSCPHCGANVSPRDPVCSYCGTPNPAYQPPIDEVNVLLEKGLKAFQQEEYALAIEAYRQAIAQDPEVFNAYFYLAASLSALGREKEAIEAMKKAQKIRPGSSVIYYNLGILYRRTGQTKEARQYLEIALERVDFDIALQDPKQMKQNIEKELRKLGRSNFRMI